MLLKWSARTVALIMIVVIHPVPGNGTLHVFDGARLECIQRVEQSSDTDREAGNPTPHSLAISDSVPCSVAYNQLYNYLTNKQWQLLCDSGKAFVERCYSYVPFVYNVFSELANAVQVLSHNDTGLYLRHREWLKTVVYLNTWDPEYFCKAISAIGGTYVSYSDTTEQLYWKEQNRQLAIAKWLIENTSCDSARHNLSGSYDWTRKSQREEWLNDTTIVWDTTLPSMAELGLDTLLAKHFVIKPPEGVKHSPEIITTVVANPNPTQNGVTLTFGMSSSAYVEIEFFDLLDNAVPIGYEGLFAEGNHAMPFTLNALPSGTYYVRIVTAYGETRTVKIVKE
jgi:hypothetical protein